MKTPGSRCAAADLSGSLAYTTPRPVESRKKSRPSVPGGASLPWSSKISDVNGGTARPTEPGCLSHSSLVIEQVVPTSVAPYASTKTGPHHSIMARFTSIGHLDPVWTTSRIEEVSYCSRILDGRSRSRMKCVGTISVDSTRWSLRARSVSSALKRPITTDATPASRERIPLSGPVWYIGPRTR